MASKNNILDKSGKVWLGSLIVFARFYVAMAILMPLFGSVVLIFQSWVLSNILNSAFVNNISRDGLLYSISLFTCLVIIRSTIAYVQELCAIKASERIKVNVRKILYETLLVNGHVWTRNQVSGAIASSIVEQVELLDGYFRKYLPVFISAAIVPLSFSIVIFCFNKIIGLILFISIPLIPLFMALIGHGAERASSKYLDSFSWLSGFFADRIRGLMTLKLYGCAQRELSSVVRASNDLKDRTLSVLKIAFLSSAVLEFFSAMGIACIAVYVGLTFLNFIRMGNDSVNLQLGLFFLLMAPEVYQPLRQMALYYHDRASAYAAVNKIEELFCGLPVIDLATSNSIKNNKLINVDFSIDNQILISAKDLEIKDSNSNRIVINKISFNILRFDHIALTGVSGVGKTSLIESIIGLRQYDGQIRFEGCDLTHLDEAILRRKTFLVSQRPYIFQDSILENIKIAKPEASYDEILEAARLSLVLDFTENIPNGLNTILGKGGMGISRGQVQRLSIARLFLRNPDFILLDEPTAHLDQDTEKKLLKNILDFSQNKTLILITHSPFIYNNMQIIWHLIDGKINNNYENII
ncbi:subfamily B ATP-binding cassette [Candidatus Kinetoplastibacterium blastocrithidii TCC012E]|uniref:Subfamily B ATP-binding cassette n=1 Tax=Candidatus Kinetoplastidibacterium blastocrithidiae TCC012E TaxID=1208922 RepID=M1LX13_9PROT|nr:thiol reductant ABC exporter subunit CydD [Candidatus Kinetoplastibacterium blastocrithidii]AFZ83253.1 ATP-binding protein cassette, subfamily B, bacterial [Candidatus Kinetoplastibacterium blastocrithidii (ex Strigomonas culicis)]AGF50067.1 subfamily B ATP-binding cassette [Candidatus Kinetoplastibacterium blastocrithidii TCC012E]